MVNLNDVVVNTVNIFNLQTVNILNNEVTNGITLKGHDLRGEILHCNVDYI